MIIFELFLTAVLLLLILLVLRSSTLYTAYKILITLLLLVGIGFVYYPEGADRIAAFLGVRRGSDLVFYLSTVFLLFVALTSYTRARRMQQQIEALTRELAKLSARRKDDGDAHPGSGEEGRR